MSNFVLRDLANSATLSTMRMLPKSAALVYSVRSPKSSKASPRGIP